VARPDRGRGARSSAKIPAAEHSGMKSAAEHSGMKSAAEHSGMKQEWGLGAQPQEY